MSATKTRETPAVGSEIVGWVQCFAAPSICVTSAATSADPGPATRTEISPVVDCSRAVDVAVAQTSNGFGCGDGVQRAWAE